MFRINSKGNRKWLTRNDCDVINSVWNKYYAKYGNEKDGRRPSDNAMIQVANEALCEYLEDGDSITDDGKNVCRKENGAFYLGGYNMKLEQGRGMDFIDTIIEEVAKAMSSIDEAETKSSKLAEEIGEKENELWKLAEQMAFDLLDRYFGTDKPLYIFDESNGLIISEGIGYCPLYAEARCFDGWRVITIRAAACDKFTEMINGKYMKSQTDKEFTFSMLSGRRAFLAAQAIKHAILKELEQNKKEE